MASTPQIVLNGHGPTDNVLHSEVFHRSVPYQEHSVESPSNDGVQQSGDVPEQFPEDAPADVPLKQTENQQSMDPAHNHGYRDLAIHSYLIALRPWSFTISLPPVALGCCLAYKTNAEFDITIFFMVCFIALCVHAAGNLVNTYYDYNKGVDTQCVSDDRTLVDNIIGQSDVVSMGAAAYFLGCIAFTVLVYISPARMELLALVYFGGLSGSFLYTGGLGLKYIALGDLVVFLIFGPVTVLFAFVAQTGSLSWIPLLYAVPLALNTESILHSNNTRDMDVDAKAGVVTLAIVLGRTGSYALFSFLLFTPYIVFALLTIHWSIWFLLPMVTIMPAFKYEKLFRLQHLQRMPRCMAKLNLQLGALYTFACFMSNVENLPGFK